jgi:ribosomal protein L37AE/L43A
MFNSDEFIRLFKEFTDIVVKMNEERNREVRTSCPGCGVKIYEPIGKDAVIWRCFSCGNEFKIDNQPGGKDLTPEMEKILADNLFVIRKYGK